MDVLHVALFHRLQVRYGDEPVALAGTKVQELLCYLILFRAKAHPREVLAETLWGDTTPHRARRYLRKTLWQLQNAIDNGEQDGETPLLHVDAEWIQLDMGDKLSLDIATFEKVYHSVEGQPGSALAAHQVQQLQSATDLYAGDLLEGWYQEWCLHERQRYQFMYLAMLDKLIGYCLAHHDYEAGIKYCTRVMRYDPTRERTHRRLMQLYYGAGDRNAALEQYTRCVTILRDELGVGPDERTQEFYRRICAGSPRELASHRQTHAGSAVPDLTAMAARLEQFRDSLAAMQRQVEADLQVLNRILQERR